MLNAEEIVKIMADRNVSEVARRSGVSRSSLHNIMSGKGENVASGIIQKLSDYLEGKVK